MTALPRPETLLVPGAGVELAVDHWANPGGQPVLLLHGGGQTRHAWGATGQVLAGLGYDVLSVDLRGHGDSGWAEARDYSLSAFRDDLRVLLDRYAAPAVLIGASLGGAAALLVAGEGPREKVRALVMVDITHRPAPGGAAKIQAFMGSAPDGFASLEEAADAVAAYLPHRRRPADPSGLMKNLRVRDGRLHWHWDPAFLGMTRQDPSLFSSRMDDAARAIACPTLLVRGGRSDIVEPRDVEAFLSLVPGSRFVEVPGAAHMVAGDENTQFGEALLGFLETEAPPQFIY